MNRMNRGFLLAACCLLPVSAMAVNLPNDHRVKMLEYHENDVYTIDTLYGYQSNIEFEEGEEIQTISVGDRSLWQLIPSGRRLFIRPMDENVSTNMTVITNLRSYQFDIRAGKGSAEDNPRLIYVARFIYPGSKNFPMAQAATAPVVISSQAPAPTPPLAQVFPVPAPTSPAAPTLSAPSIVMPPPPPIVPLAKDSYVSPTPIEPLKRNYLYSFSGKDDLAPLDTYDDGVSTFIKFPDPSRTPRLYQVGSAGSKTLVPYQMKDGVAVANAVAERWMVEYDANTNVILYNESKNQGGK